MSNKHTRTLRSEASAVSLNLELANLEHALRGTSLLAELLANHNLPDEEARRMAPHCIAAQLALVNARLRQVGRVIRGEEGAERLWAVHNATLPSPLPGDDGDVRLVSKSPPPFARNARKTVARKPAAKKGPEKPPAVEETPPAPGPAAP